MMPYGLKEIFEAAYPIIQERLKAIPYSHDTSSLFNNFILSPYMDFCHVNENANKAIASEMFLQILKN